MEAMTQVACALCREIPRATHTGSETHLPKAIQRLEPKVELKGERQELGCPECGARYLFTYSADDEWPTPNEMYSLTRVPTVRDQLDHADEWVRREAAHDIATILLGTGEHDELVARMLAHARAEVRQESLDAVPWAMAPASVLARAEAMLGDPDARVRGAAAKMLCGRWVRDRELARVLALVERDDPAVRGPALSSVSGGTEPTEVEALLPFLPRILALVDAADDASRNAAGRLLPRFVSKEPFGSQGVAALGRALDHDERAVRWHAAYVLAEVLRRGAPIGPAVDVLVRRLEDRTITHMVADALLKCPDPEMDLGPFVPALERLLRKLPGEDWRIFSLCERAFAHRSAGTHALVLPLKTLAHDKRHASYANKCLDAARAAGVL
jgi:hypothetical protein